MIITGIVGFWLLLESNDIKACDDQLMSVQHSFEEVIETGASLQFLSVRNSSLSLNFGPDESGGYILEMFFQNETEAKTFYRGTIEAFKLFEREEIIEEFSDDQLNMAFALLINETPTAHHGNKIIFKLPSPSTFFKGVRNWHLLEEASIRT